jgi:hypothetical protein
MEADSTNRLNNAKTLREGGAGGFFILLPSLHPSVVFVMVG